MPDLPGVSIRNLPLTTPPIPDGGGRLSSPQGELAQIVNGQEGFRFMVYLEFRPGSEKPRGNHFHRLKRETLYIIAGRILACYEDVRTGESMESELSAGTLAVVEPGIAHAYYSIDHAHALEMSPNVYDPVDTIAYQTSKGALTHGL
jgi:quercetin dioxygenase-like cupin family protein